MKFNSYEISNLLFQKQLDMYLKIDKLIQNRFDELDPEILSVLTRTQGELSDKIEIYTKDLKHREMFNVNYTRNKKENKLESISLIEIYSSLL
jgi:hypothetical protein